MSNSISIPSAKPINKSTEKKERCEKDSCLEKVTGISWQKFGKSIIRKVSEKNMPLPKPNPSKDWKPDRNSFCEN